MILVQRASTTIHTALEVSIRALRLRAKMVIQNIAILLAATLLAFTNPAFAQPLPPTPSSPGTSSAPGPSITDLTPTMQWQASANATGYGLYVSRNDSGVWTLVYDNDSVSNVTSLTLPSGTVVTGRQYRWNMRARNASGWSAYSGRLYFQTGCTTPSAPSLQSPGASSAPGPSVTDLTPTMQWQAASGATGYGLYVSRNDSGVWTLVYDNDNVSNVTSLTLPSGTVVAGRQYRWNMRARNTCGWGGFSGQFYFQTGCTTPSAPGLQSPGGSSAPGPLITDLTPTMQWQASANATGYGLYVSRNDSGVWTLVYDNDSVSNVTSLTLPSGTVVTGRQYRWNMRARNTCGWGVFSGQFYFQTGCTTPAVPGLQSPGASSAPGPSITDLTPTMQWQASANATEYGLYVSRNDSGVWTLVYDNDSVANVTSLTLPSTALVAGRQYRWNMRARNACGWSGFTGQFYFTVSPPPCTYTLTPSSAMHGPGGSSYSFNVAAGPACAWTASDNRTWITTTTTSGTGDGMVTYSVSQNTGTSARTGSISVLDQTFAVTQEGAAPALGACCIGGNTCTSSLTLDQCASRGGVWQGPGSTSCLACEVTGACCIGGNTCDTGVTSDSCIAQGGVWQGPDSSACTNCNPPTGACCIAGTTCATAMTEIACSSEGGIWQGPDSTGCIDCPPAVTGACCLGGTTCATGMTEIDCTSQGGVWQGQGTLSCPGCGTGPCPPPSPQCSSAVPGQVNGLVMRVPWLTDQYYRVSRGECQTGEGHHGYEVDFAMVVGTPICAVARGYVVQTGSDEDAPNGIFARVQHRASDGVFYNSTYLHFSRLDVACGDVVERGTQIGLSGNTGWSTGPHLHFQLQRSAQDQDRFDCVPPTVLENVRPVRMFGQLEGTTDTSICEFIMGRRYGAAAIGGFSCVGDFDDDDDTDSEDTRLFFMAWDNGDIGGDADSDDDLDSDDVVAFFASWDGGC